MSITMHISLLRDDALRVTKALAADRRGQDMIEYGLMAAMVAIVVAGFLPTEYAPSLSTIWSKVTCVMTVLVP